MWQRLCGPPSLIYFLSTSSQESVPAPGQRMSIASPGSNSPQAHTVQSVPLEWKWPGASERWLGGLGWLRELLRRPCWPLPVWAPALGAEVAGATSPCTPYLEYIILSYPFADTLLHPHPLFPLLVGENSVWKLKHRLADSGWNCTQTSLSLAPRAQTSLKGPILKDHPLPVSIVRWAWVQDVRL